MDQPTQESFRPVIDARLADIETELDVTTDSTKPIAPDVSVGRLSRLDSMQMQQMALAGKRRLEEQRARLHEARRRIDSGTFGRCLQCGNDISIERLQYQPDAVTCMPCLQALAAKKGR
jgi:DnaK suppressor protein